MKLAVVFGIVMCLYGVHGKWIGCLRVFFGFRTGSEKLVWNCFSQWLMKNHCVFLLVKIFCGGFFFIAQNETFASFEKINCADLFFLKCFSFERMMVCQLENVCCTYFFLRIWISDVKAPRRWCVLPYTQRAFHKEPANVNFPQNHHPPIFIVGVN